MRTSYLFNATGTVLKYISIVILIPALVAIYYKDYYSIIPFVTASLVSLVLGFILNPKKIDADNLNNIKRSEALFIVAFSWIMFALISAIPFLFYKIGFLDSLFEAISGITTTGSTILKDYSLYPKTMFFWRSFNQWLGGMGIIVLFIAVLPQFAVAGRQMFLAEAPGPTDQKFTPRIKQTASSLWKIYTALTLIEIILLKMAGMPLFDSVCNSLSTLAGGGLSPNPLSIAGYNCPTCIWIMIIFMFLSGTNFALQYRVITKRKPLEFFKDEEFRYYFGITVIFSIIITVLLYLNHQFNLTGCIREALFQVVSTLTTGFASSDFQTWPIDIKMFLYLLMFVGGCAGSAAGGIKVIRLVFVAKYIKREISKIHHPNAVYPIKINRQVISQEIIQEMIVFVIFYYLIFAISAFAVAMIEKNAVIALTGAISTLGNIGPGFEQLGPMSHYGFLHPVTKIIFMINMLVGRLELIPFLAILHPDFWNFKK